MTTGLVKQAVDVVQGVPQQVADRIEAAFGEIGVAAACKVRDTIVRIDVSLLEDIPEARVLGVIEQSAKDVAARIRWVDPAAVRWRIGGGCSRGAPRRPRDGARRDPRRDRSRPLTRLSGTSHARVTVDTM